MTFDLENLVTYLRFYSLLARSHLDFAISTILSAHIFSPVKNNHEFSQQNSAKYPVVARLTGHPTLFRTFVWPVKFLSWPELLVFAKAEVLSGWSSPRRSPFLATELTQRVWRHLEACVPLQVVQANTAIVQRLDSSMEYCTLIFGMSMLAFFSFSTAKLSYWAINEIKRLCVKSSAHLV